MKHIFVQVIEIVIMHKGEEYDGDDGPALDLQHCPAEDDQTQVLKAYIIFSFNSTHSPYLQRV